MVILIHRMYEDYFATVMNVFTGKGRYELNDGAAEFGLAAPQLLGGSGAARRRTAGRAARCRAGLRSDGNARDYNIRECDSHDREVTAAKDLFGDARQE
jgi:hypothetical protein